LVPRDFTLSRRVANIILFMFKTLRIVLLLFILASVAAGTWRAKTRAVQWKYPLHAVVFPINGDASAASMRYLAGLTSETFKPIEDFIEAQAKRYGIKVAYGRPVQIALAPEVKARPPAPPLGGNVLSVVFWSLKLRYWAWRNDEHQGVPAQIRLFVLFHDPATNPKLAHSLGLEKGMVGVVNVFAARQMAAENDFVIAHELLHTVGASDKYDPRTNRPLFPDGYAEPELEPRHPQLFAEIMGGRVPISETRAEIPRGLPQALIAEKTAREIGWRK
jgi:hypothetical protein